MKKEQHICKAIEDTILTEIERHGTFEGKQDGKPVFGVSDWSLWLRHDEKDNSKAWGCTIEYCPWCGKKLISEGE